MAQIKVRKWYVKHISKTYSTICLNVKVSVTSNDIDVFSKCQYYFE